MAPEAATRVAEADTRAVDGATGAHQVEATAVTAIITLATAAGTLDHHRAGCLLHLARRASEPACPRRLRRRREVMRVMGVGFLDLTATVVATAPRHLLTADNITAAAAVVHTKTKDITNHHPLGVMTATTGGEGEEGMLATGAMIEVATVKIGDMEMAAGIGAEP